MLVTVVVPLYRGKKYIEPKIRMFEKAFIKADIVDKAEVLFINDYPDEIIELPESQISVRLLSNEKNQGIQRTRMRGILESNATYIHMLDQDDEIKEDFYLENLKFAPGNDVVVSNCIMELENSGERILYRNALEKKNAKSPMAFIFLDCRIISPGQCLIRRESIPEFWLQHPLSKNGTDDYLLWLLMFELKAKFVVNMTPLYVHKYTGVNLSLNKDVMIKSHEELVKVLELFPRSKYAKWIRSKVYSMKGEKKEYAFLFTALMDLRKLRIKLFEKG